MPPTDTPGQHPSSLLRGDKDDGRRFLSGAFGELGAVPAPTLPVFVETREHRKFIEFADMVREHRYIGLCYGQPGVGKTLSARHHAGADEYASWRSLAETDETLPPVPEQVLRAKAAFFTPTVAATIKQIDQGLPRTCQQLSWTLDYAEHGAVDPLVRTQSQFSGRTELLVIDEADRLKAVGLEQVRDFYDRHNMGVILIGMPGIEKRLARYPQLYSRIGFAHEYRPLNTDELTAVIAKRLPEPAPQDNGVAHTAALAAIARITNGNFRLADRLVTQIDRILHINNLDQLTPEVVDAAREALLLGH